MKKCKGRLRNNSVVKGTDEKNTKKKNEKIFRSTRINNSSENMEICQQRKNKLYF